MHNYNSILHHYEEVTSYKNITKLDIESTFNPNVSAVFFDDLTDYEEDNEIISSAITSVYHF